MLDVVLAERMDVALALTVEHVPAGGRVLDAGCGAGVTAVELAKRGFIVHASDIAPAMVDAARAAFVHNDVDPTGHQFSVGDVTNGDMPEASFDAVLALGVLQYQPDEDRAMRELARTLRPGGVLIVTGPARAALANGFGLRDARWFDRAKRMVGFGRPTSEAVVSLHEYSLRRFRRLVASAGLTMVAEVPHGFGPIMVLSRLLPLRAQIAVHRLLSRLRPLGTKAVASNLVIVARKP
jgi:2-polyprenyl-3-methyl-5-hydroxy-6-metoxy-1,4-benzoquinol methylase